MSGNLRSRLDGRIPERSLAEINSILGAPQIVATESTRGEYIDRVVKIKRCAAVVKGGRRFSFAAMVVIGDGNGRVGWGYGKANEVPPSVEKAQKQATREMIEVPLVDGTIPHQVKGRFSAARVDPPAGRAWYRCDRRRCRACGL